MGYKVLARSGVSGYVYQIEVYEGATVKVPAVIPQQNTARDSANEPSTSTAVVTPKRSTRSTDIYQTVDAAALHADELGISIDYLRRCGLGGQVVLRLSKGLAAGTRIHFDNFFSSVTLFKVLTEMGLNG